MADDRDAGRRRILDRADRMLEQSHALRKLADELASGSRDRSPQVRKASAEALPSQETLTP
jgi:hypothetical protein